MVILRAHRRHVLITHDGTINDSTTVKIYADNAGTYGDDINGASETASTGKWCIGGRTYDDNRNFDGKIAEVAVWNRVLSAGEIANLAGGYAPSLVPTNLVFYFSGKSDDLTAEVGGEGTATGAVYDAAHPTIDYSAESPSVSPSGHRPLVLANRLAQAYHRRLVHQYHQALAQAYHQVSHRVHLFHQVSAAISPSVI